MYNFLAAKKYEAFDFKAIFSNITTQWYYYLALIAMLSAIILLIFAFKPQKKVILKRTYYISVLAVMISLTVVANILSFGPDDWKMSLVPVICFIAGYIFGPAFGFATGFVGDFIGAIIAPMGVYNPILGLGTGLWGFFPGLILNYFKGNNYIKIVITFVVGYIICSLCINTVCLYLMYAFYSRTYGTLYAYLLVRLLPTFVCSFLFNAFLAFVCFKPIERIKTRLLNRQVNISPNEHKLA